MISAYIILMTYRQQISSQQNSVQSDTWPQLQHKMVKFSLQNSQSLDFHDGRQRVWSRTGERYKPLAMTAHDRYAGGSVMVWGGITMTERIELHICQGHVTGLYYRDSVTESVVVPYAHRHENAFIFQDDNTLAHRSRVVQDHLQFQRFSTLPWPAKSPDLFQLDICGTS